MDVFGVSADDTGLGNQYVGEPRIAKGLCVIGALRQKTTGSVQGQFAKLVPDSKDDADGPGMSLNYYIDNEERHSNSKETTSMGPEGGYGLFVNNACGAPMSTFVFGGIAPAGIEANHPVLNLIQGPPSTQKCVTFTGDSIPYYAAPYINFSDTALFGSVETDIVDDSGQVDVNAYYVNNNPLIPTRHDDGITFNGGAFDLYSAAKPLMTYNIWKMRYPARFQTSTFNIENYIEYVQDFGPIINTATASATAQAYDGPLINQMLFATGSKVSISTPKDFVFVERLYPISNDLLYTNFQTNPIMAYYSLIGCDDGTIDAPSPVGVTMTGGQNCGFQMHFECSGIDPSYSASKGSLAPSIIINWGDQNTQSATSINKFQLVVSSQGTELRYFNPTKQIYNVATNEGVPTPVDTRWIRLKLPNGRSLTQDSVSFSVYIHYAGPYMFIGFGDLGNQQSVQWYSLGPVDDDSQPKGGKLDLSISDQATVAIGLGYMNAVFQYGPMTFKNYNNQNITNSQSIVNKEYLNHFDFTFTAPQGKQQYLDTKTIQNNFYNLAYTTRSAAANKDTNMSYAPDWRTPLKNQFGFVWRTPITLLPTGAAEADQVDPLYYIQGTLQYSTTFEGPVFYEITNNITPITQPNPPYVPLNVNASNRVVGNTTNGTDQNNLNALIRNFSWGDISTYLTEWEMTYSCEDTANSSYLSMNGTATFKDMTLDTLGRKILTAIGKNRMTISLGAGYTADYPVIFGQGVITSIKTRRNGKGSITTMKFEDIGTHLLKKSIFKDPYIFGGMKYRRVVQSILQILGFEQYYSQRPDTINVDWGNALNLRASVNGLQPSIIGGSVRVDSTTVPYNVMQTFLKVMIEKNAVPIFWWDCVDQLFRMEWRQAPEFVENLYFAGYNSGNTGALLPNTQNTPEDIANSINRDWQHGVLVDSWDMDTGYQNLIYKLTLWAKDSIGKLMSYQYFAPNAISDNVWNSLNNLKNVRMEDIPGGYIGYENIRFDKDDNAIFEDKNALYKFGDAIVDSIIGNPYDTIDFQVYVTRPLLHWGRFALLTFIGDGSAQTEPYFYKNVHYKFTKGQNIITADIKGEYTPPLKAIMGNS